MLKKEQYLSGTEFETLTDSPAKDREIWREKMRMERMIRKEERVMMRGSGGTGTRDSECWRPADDECVLPHLNVSFSSSSR